MLQWDIALRLASGRTSPHADLLSIFFFLMFGLVGFSLFLNLAGVAEKTLNFMSKIMFGFVGGASRRMMQIIGALIFLMSCIGLAVESFVSFSG